MRTMGLDVGEKRIGVAVSDPEGTVAVALTVIEIKSADVALRTIAELTQDHEVAQVVVGLPRSLDGSLGKQAEAVQAFVELLGSYVDVPVVTWDERFSTAAAERMMRSAGVKRDRLRKKSDAVAAAFILQGYLDRQRSESGGLD